MDEQLLGIAGWPLILRLLLRLLVAAVLGALVGMEREHRGRPAGLRTQLLVALGAALAMAVGVAVAEQYGSIGASGLRITVDPTRMAYGVVVGIGFLGGGVILRQGVNVMGITTAASLWCTAGIGLACGLGTYALALFAASLVLIALFVLSRLDRMVASGWMKTVRIRCRASGRDNLEHFRALLVRHKCTIADESYRRDNEHKTETLTFQVQFTTPPSSADLNWFSEDPDVLEFSIR